MIKLKLILVILLMCCPVLAISGDSFDDLRKAAEQGHAAAQYKLGLIYHDGDGVNKDYMDALKWYKKAAEQGYADAQYKLGVMCQHGEGVTKNIREALEWYRKAAEQGHIRAQNNLGFIYVMGDGVAKDYKAAAEWYRKAAEQGYADAQFNLGLMYVFGDGVAKDYKVAAEWFRKAAEQGHAGAQHNLGLSYASGNGVTKDYKVAATWYRKAAEQGYADAQFNLGLMYALGYGVTKDNKKAIKWCRKAAEQGHANAQQFIDIASKQETAPWIGPKYIWFDRTNPAYCILYTSDSKLSSYPVEGEKGYKMSIRGEDFIKNPKKYIKKCTIINEYRQFDLDSELPIILAKTSNKFGLTWNSGLAFTAKDYRHAETRYKLYMENPDDYLRAPKQRPAGDANYPGNLLPFLRMF